jgi:hypothetical protein
MKKGMRMKKQLLMIGISLILILVGLSGCTQQQTSSDQTPLQTTPPTRESLETILAKTDSIDSMSFDVTASITMSQFGTQTAQIKIWQKIPYLKEQITMSSSAGTTSITIIHRPEGNYTYDPIQQKYLLTPNATSFASSLQYFDNTQIKAYLNNLTSTDFKTETIDGKQATVIEYSPLQEGNQMTVKLWIWNDKGVPLKAYIDMTMEQTAMTMDFRFTNYSFTDIPDSVFSVS